MSRLTIPLIALLAILAVLAGASLFTVEQTEQVLITQLGEPIDVITTPGLHAKLPFVQTVISFDNRLLDFDVPREEVILGDQRRLIVDSFRRPHRGRHPRPPQLGGLLLAPPRPRQ
jgi:membrane protease subunit HflC